ncbi:uncharacterized protein BJ171DRAFT_576471 [Polychytrium aggregatum]|uniref:uncharacterized protein n=1 Tax=Polychytrium aggregatum TaxID=110093 RepID=UPI0022FDC104|nr:uncharacterized protein BJ171DRAFT_576471 [Polychytrium aggregatum]KAI9209681.1 hypothetical protein BJ171DRAFT_576471 [Polychytrium aggregatum]
MSKTKATTPPAPVSTSNQNVESPAMRSHLSNGSSGPNPVRANRGRANGYSNGPDRRDYASAASASRNGRGKWNAQGSSPRVNSPTPNDSRNALSTSSSTSEIISEDHSRLLFVLMNMTGMKVEVVTRCGTTYEGILHGANTSGDFGVVLKMARLHAPNLVPGKTNTNPLIKELIIPPKDFLSMSALAVETTTTDKLNESDTFRTDTGISGFAGDLRERELTRWSAETGDAALEGLEDSLALSNGMGAWDQFAANEKLFGVTTDFEMDMYTTALDRNAPGFDLKEAHAARIANEIEKALLTSARILESLKLCRASRRGIQSTSSNIHVQEERGQTAESVTADEEERFSSVHRSTELVRQPGKYVPPDVRQKHNLHAGGLRPPASKDKPLAESSGSAAAATEGKSTPASSSPAGLPKPRDVSELKDAPPLLATKISIEQMGKGYLPPTEAIILKDFKEFANREKQQLLMKKQMLNKKEKDGIIQEFKVFSANFKLNSPVPKDLVEILNKDKEKEKDEDEHKDKSDEPAKVEKDAAKAPAEAVKAAKLSASASPSSSASKKKSSLSEKSTSPTVTLPQKALSVSGDASERKPVSSSDSTSAAESASPETPAPAVAAAAAAAAAASSSAGANALKAKGFKFNVSALEFTPSAPSEPNPVASSPPTSEVSATHNEKHSYEPRPKNFSKSKYNNKGGSHYNKGHNAVPAPTYDPDSGAVMYPPPGDYGYYAMNPYYRPMMHPRPPFVPGMTPPITGAPPGPAVPAYLPYFAPIPPGAPYPPGMMPNPPNMIRYPKGAPAHTNPGMGAYIPEMVGQFPQPPPQMMMPPPNGWIPGPGPDPAHSAGAHMHPHHAGGPHHGQHQPYPPNGASHPPPPPLSQQGDEMSVANSEHAQSAESVTSNTGRPGESS